MKTSRIPGFYQKELDKRQEIIANLLELSSEEKQILTSNESLPKDIADKMIENVIGTFSLPFGLGLNFLINQKEYLVPMVIEEPSVVASSSYMAKIVREAGGFTTSATDRLMIGQIQVAGCSDFQDAKQKILEEKEEIILTLNDIYPSIVKRGGGAKDLDVRILNEDEDSPFQKMLILYAYIDTCYAM